MKKKPINIPEMKTALIAKIRANSREECVRVIDNFARAIQSVLTA